MDFNVQIDSSNWQNIIQGSQNEIIRKRELETDALQLRANATRFSDPPKSYSVYIIDDDGKTETRKSVIRIEPKFAKNREEFILYVNDDKLPYISIPEGVETKKPRQILLHKRLDSSYLTMNQCFFK